MTSPISWLSPAMMHALGWALIHFLWQGAAIAALAAILMHFSRGPSTRYCVGVVALTLMLAMPFVTLLLADDFAPHVPTSIFSEPLSTAVPLKAVGLAASSTMNLNDSSIIHMRPALISPPLDVLPWLVECWLIGVVLLGLRFAGGFLVLEQRQRWQSRAPCAEVLVLCQTVQRRLGLTRTVRYLECGWVKVPAVIGCIRPTVLLPITALTGLTETQLRAVIAHELAHVRRWDLLVNLFQVLAETLLFYHPAIWWLNKRIRAERELCCDEIALSETVDRAEYADALLLMAKLGSASSLVMAATHGVLSERIFHIIGRPSERSHIVGLVGGMLFFMAAIVTGKLVLAAPLPGFHGREDTQYVASLARLSAKSQPTLLPVGPVNPTTTTARSNDDEYVIPRRNWLASIRTIRPSPISLSSALLPIASVNPGSQLAPHDQPVVAASQADVRAAPDASPVLDTPVAAKELEALTVAKDEYPAPVLKLLGPFNWHDGQWADAMYYCKDYAAQTVTQGANRPIAVDDGLKQRLAFFYWYCMFNNGKVTLDGPPIGPAYSAIGQGASGNPVNASGNWTIAVHAQPTRICSFAQSGNTLSGTCTGREGSSAVVGIIDGRQVRWAWKYSRDDELDFIGMVGLDGTMTGQSILVRALPHYLDHLESFTGAPGGTQVASRN